MNLRRAWKFQGLPGVTLFEGLAESTRDIPVHIHRKNMVMLVLSGFHDLQDEVSGKRLQLQSGHLSYCPAGTVLSGGSSGHTLSLAAPPLTPNLSSRPVPSPPLRNTQTSKSLQLLFRQLTHTCNPQVQRRLFQRVQRELRRLGPQSREPLDHPSPGNLESLLFKVREVLEQRFQEKLTLEQLAQEVAWHPHHLQKSFRRYFKLSPQKYQSQLRAERALELLCRGSSAAEVAQSLGFCDQSHFIKAFRSYHGTTPKSLMSRFSYPRPEGFDSLKA